MSKYIPGLLHISCAALGDTWALEQLGIVLSLFPDLAKHGFVKFGKDDQPISVHGSMFGYI